MLRRFFKPVSPFIMTWALPGRRYLSSIATQVEKMATHKIPNNILQKLDMNLHLQKHHPLNTIKTEIEDYFTSNYNSSKFKSFDSLSPIVTVKQNFDELLTPADHPSRSKSETYYIQEDTVLRCHTSAHQCEVIKAGHTSFLVSGDVYRRDEIDRTHFPVFHQMEAVRLFKPEELNDMPGKDTEQKVTEDLKKALEGMTHKLFGDVEMRWVEAYFPFTHPSYELEIFYQDDWLEVLGCGMIQPDILKSCGLDPSISGWAFGIGLERIAMSLFKIPDIRLFWTEDDRFHRQFRPVESKEGAQASKATATSKNGDRIVFQPYSKYPAVERDVAFWVPENYHPNDFFELVREVVGDNAEETKLMDEFTHPKTQRTSHMYRITYRSMDRSLTNQEINERHEGVRSAVTSSLGGSLR